MMGFKNFQTAQAIIAGIEDHSAEKANEPASKVSLCQLNSFIV
jgi:hypothetical protein